MSYISSKINERINELKPDKEKLNKLSKKLIDAGFIEISDKQFKQYKLPNNGLAMEITITLCEPPTLRYRYTTKEYEASSTAVFPPKGISFFGKKQTFDEYIDDTYNKMLDIVNKCISRSIVRKYPIEVNRPFGIFPQ